RRRQVDILCLLTNCQDALGGRVQQLPAIEVDQVDVMDQLSRERLAVLVGDPQLHATQPTVDRPREGLERRHCVGTVVVGRTAAVPIVTAATVVLIVAAIAGVIAMTAGRGVIVPSPSGGD